jgi:hypothetical protein
MTCSENACTASCSDGAIPPDVQCGTACACEPC